MRQLPLSQHKDQLTRLVPPRSTACSWSPVSRMAPSYSPQLSALSSRASSRSGGRRPIAPASAGTGARSRRSLGARRSRERWRLFEN